jgi:serine/threonine-protein kinase
MIGETIGNYRVVSLLGGGGMGSVFVAEHPKIGRRVAIKVLRLDLMHGDDVVERFFNEARAANAIRHPNIIEILDAGFLPGGSPYMIMELLEGETVEARLRRLKRLPLGAAIDIGVQAASALGAAHQKGIIHRDLKPENLFLVAGGGAIRPDALKVLDFGVAKLRGPLGNPLVHTRLGALLGTPKYMSPEQCRGTGEVDPRSDVYALAAILYETLVGKPPFEGEGVVRLMSMHMYLHPPPLRSRLASIPEALEKVVMKALEKRPEDRFQTMEELGAALRAVTEPSTAVVPAGDAPSVIAGSRLVRFTPAQPERRFAPAPADTAAPVPRGDPPPKAMFVTIGVGMVVGLAGAVLILSGADPEPPPEPPALTLPAGGAQRVPAVPKSTAVVTRDRGFAPGASMASTAPSKSPPVRQGGDGRRKPARGRRSDNVMPAASEPAIPEETPNSDDVINNPDEVMKYQENLDQEVRR